MTEYTTLETLFISFVYLMPFWSVMGVIIMISLDDTEYIRKKEEK